MTVKDREHNHVLDAKVVLDQLMEKTDWDGMLMGTGDLVEMGWPGKLVILSGEDEQEVYVVSVKRIR